MATLRPAVQPLFTFTNEGEALGAVPPRCRAVDLFDLLEEVGRRLPAEYLATAVNTHLAYPELPLSVCAALVAEVEDRRQAGQPAVVPRRDGETVFRYRRWGSRLVRDR